MTWKQAAAARRFCLAVAFLGVVGTLGGCSSVPDAVNPVSWYRGVRDTFSSDDTKPAAEAKTQADRSVPNADKPYPSLGTVPDRPPEPSTAAERAAAAKSLTADSAQARYTDMEIRRQTDESTAQPPRPSTPSAAPATGVAATTPAPARTAPDWPAASAAPASATPSNWPAASTAPARNVAPPPVAPSVAPLRTAAAPTARPATAPRQLPPGSMPQISAAPPPPAQIATAPPAASVVPRAEPPARSVAPAAPAAQRRSSTPAAPLVFGPPPTDIAIAQAAPPPSRSSRAAPQFAPPPAQFAGGVRTATPASPYSPYFPAGVSSFVPDNGGYGFGAGAKLATVYFGDGSAKLGSRDVTTIRQAIRAYKDRGGTIVVVGHASSRTRNVTAMRHEMANFAISLDRANAVAREILRLGVDPLAVRVSAVSDSQPVYYEVMPAGEAGNRRTDILIEN